VIKRCGCGDKHYPLSGTAFGGVDVHWPVCLSTNTTQGKSFKLNPGLYYDDMLALRISDLILVEILSSIICYYYYFYLY